MTQAWAIKGPDGEVVNLELSEGDNNREDAEAKRCANAIRGQE